MSSLFELIVNYVFINGLFITSHPFQYYWYHYTKRTRALLLEAKELNFPWETSEEPQ